MEAVENTGEPVPSPTAATVFHFYSRLPPELKLKVWTAFYEDPLPGAHRFRLSILSSNYTRLAVRPDDDQKRDASAWRERRAIARVDKYAFDALLKLKRSATILYKDIAHNHPIRVWENGMTAMVNGKTDLLTFRCYYGYTKASVAWLSVRAHSELFANITQIAVDENNLGGGNGKNRPFECLCLARHAATRKFCLRTLCEFIRFFKDLKVFYRAFSLDDLGLANSLDLSTIPPQKLPRLYTAKGGAKQVRLDVFRRLQEIAQEKGLKQFHDRRGTYCEVQYKDALHFFGPKIGKQTEEISKTWTAVRANRDWANIEFKALVWANLQGVTVSGEEQPLRTAKPWY
ncbi:hypothetical protein GQX73_g9261 [Xylaria multiplex]|uniref:Uncharacterized protein n=1 Tax=Xylaria multiplex TaxID=323545 RepID=A0A7C8MZ20_9PEZI|nr:hypothetical protein GQX73_g9261 [Xylaria multiplex]